MRAKVFVENLNNKVVASVICFGKSKKDIFQKLKNLDNNDNDIKVYFNTIEYAQNIKTTIK